jgi:capsular polysaccharide export protein
MVTRGLNSFQGKQVLFLQGPIGPFFKNLGCDLENFEATVYKVNFNGGDWFFSDSTNSINFTGSIDEWPDFFKGLVERYRIDVVLLFGDCRAHHSIAHAIATEKGIEVGVFEEVYVRPDYITFEEYGVNANSKISKDAEFYRTLKEDKYDFPQKLSVGYTFWYTAWWAFLYYLFSSLLFPKFIKYRHHRPLNPFELFYWIRAIWRKWLYKWNERGIQETAASKMSKKFYLVPLQIATDAQIKKHYEHKSIDIFLNRVIASFANNAPKNSWLIIKHHPLDRGYHNHGRCIKKLAKTHDVEERVKYIHDQHLPILLEHAKGCIVINSTVGLSAIHHNTPLKVCGDAIYDINGLVYKGELDTFWKDADLFTIDRDLYLRFKGYLINQKQINGNFYKPLKISSLKSGILWN